MSSIISSADEVEYFSCRKPREYRRTSAYDVFCSVTLQRIASFTPSRVFGSSIAGVAEGAPEGVSGVEEFGSLSGVEASSSSGSICCTLPYEDMV